VVTQQSFPDLVIHGNLRLKSKNRRLEIAQQALAERNISPEKLRNLLNIEQWLAAARGTSLQPDRAVSR